jgi:putative ABC transport system substrate-binding protein
MSNRPLSLCRPYILLLLVTVWLLGFSACDTNTTTVSNTQTKPETIGFIDFVEDATLAQARQGFLDALKESGLSEDSGTLKVIYRNAQGDQPTLIQSIDYMLSQDPVLIAANTTLATISAAQRTQTIPVFMMVAPEPSKAGLTDKEGNAPSNLFGVYETTDYIDTSVTLIKRLFPGAKKVGAIYSQSEPQSLEALEQLKRGCIASGMQLEALPVTNSSETQLVTQSLLSRGVEVFFALPDNAVFASFESIVKVCNSKNIPILTSEAGLVARGAVASYGADMYQWGYQSGQQAAQYIWKGKTTGLRPEPVQQRKRVFNPTAAERFGVQPDSTFIRL